MTHAFRFAMAGTGLNLEGGKLYDLRSLKPDLLFVRRNVPYLVPAENRQHNSGG